MAMELPDGKTARNIQEQVKFLTEKLKDLYARVNDLEVKIVKVDELPEEGEFGTIYLLPVEDPEEGNYFEEYIYFDGEWELIGTTQIDLSGYVDLTSAQTITGVKTIQNELDFKYDANSTALWKLKAGGDYSFGFERDNSSILSYITTQGFGFDGDVYSQNNQDLGKSASKWKDLYLSGKAYFGVDTIETDASNFLVFKVNGSTRLTLFTGSEVRANGNFTPQVSATYDLGGSSLSWKDLYLGGAIKNSDKINLRPNSVSYDLFSVSSSEVLTWVGIRPAANGSLNLGTATSKWQNLYLSGNVDFGDNAKIEKDSSNRVCLIAGNDTKLKIGNDTLLKGRFIPDSNNSYDLGYSSSQWRDLYLSRNLTDGTNSVSVAQIASGLGGTYRHRLLIANSGESFELSIDISSSTAITTLAGLAPYVGKIEGAFAYRTVGSSYEVVLIDSIDTTSEEIDYEGSQGLDTATQIDVQADIVVQL